MSAQKALMVFQDGALQSKLRSTVTSRAAVSVKTTLVMGTSHDDRKTDPSRKKWLHVLMTTS